MRASFESGPDIANSTNPDIRLFTVPKLRALGPTDEIKASWQLCNPTNTPSFTAGQGSVPEYRKTAGKRGDQRGEFSFRD